MLLAISTSQSQISLALGEDGVVRYSREEPIAPNGGTDLGALVQEALAAAGITVSALTGILTDTGPGGTSSVRTGVAFANALAYSRNIPVTPVTATELVGRDVFAQLQCPVLVIIPSIKQQYYHALYDGATTELQYGSVEAIVSRIAAHGKKLAIAGYGKILPSLQEQVPGVELVFSGVQKVKATLMITEAASFAGYTTRYPVLPTPVTETSV
jgi:tRNA threonylcarbamoyl adenosine modification protein YeaZ